MTPCQIGDHQYYSILKLWFDSIENLQREAVWFVHWSGGIVLQLFMQGFPKFVMGERAKSIQASEWMIIP